MESDAKSDDDKVKVISTRSNIYDDVIKPIEKSITAGSIDNIVDDSNTIDETSDDNDSNDDVIIYQYCVKCREKTPSSDITIKKTKNNLRLQRSKCTGKKGCGSYKTMFVKNQDILKEEPVKEFDKDGNHTKKFLDAEMMKEHETRLKWQKIADDPSFKKYERGAALAMVNKSNRRITELAKELEAY